MEESLLIRVLGSSPIIKILDFLLDNRPFETTKNETVNKTGLSRAIVFKVWKILEKYSLVKETKKYGNVRLYKLNIENPVVQKLIDFESSLIEQYTEQVARQYNLTTPLKIKNR